ncbi:hypothetical protein [Fusicatenibacter saccharivorans]|uniref:hypothetical protein n=1 Tax=Fusicatenibacter saccharivorans TaxID=1150298 RepID=UPI00157034F2|nr:hypothetical protein [Fusicatenibacter saccharivorans]NSE10602.1 hypothetical protein [Fusicatenibacter saccharivorans]
MAANKTVLDHLRLLECLKWNTDAAHPLTQKNLRKEASESEDTLDCLGDKKTFRKRLATLATFCNCDSDTSNWHIYYDGVEKDLKPDPHRKALVPTEFIISMTSALQNLISSSIKLNPAL